MTMATARTTVPSPTWKPKVGDLVCLRRTTKRFPLRPGEKRPRVAAVKAHLSDVVGGLVLDKELGGCRCWNVLDVQPAAVRKRKEGAS